MQNDELFPAARPARVTGHEEQGIPGKPGFHLNNGPASAVNSRRGLGEDAAGLRKHPPDSVGSPSKRQGRYNGDITEQHAGNTLTPGLRVALRGLFPRCPVRLPSELPKRTFGHSWQDFLCARNGRRPTDRKGWRLKCRLPRAGLFGQHALAGTTEGDWVGVRPASGAATFASRGASELFQRVRRGGACSQDGRTGDTAKLHPSAPPPPF